MKNQTTLIATAISSAMLLSSCGGSSDSGEKSSMSLYVTDAPVDSAEAVVVQFSSVTLKANGRDDEYFEFNPPKSIDLLKLQGMESQPLLENVSVPAGKYTQIILGVNAEFDTVLDTYITTLDGKSYEMRVPSGSNNGLKLNRPFTVAAGTESIDVANEGSIYTIDFNLRKSVVNPEGELNPYAEPGDPVYFLKPVLRFVQNIETGSIKGMVSAGLLTGSACTDDGDPATNNAVYAFEGANVTPDDYDGKDAEAITTAIVKSNGYELGYLSEGTYTIAFTCAADAEDADGVNDDAIEFLAVANVDVVAGEVTEHHISE